MTNQEFENTIRETLKTDETPNRVGFAHMLSQLPVTETAEVRYTRETATSNIIINIQTSISAVWKTKRFVLIPSLILLLFVGTFSLSPRSHVSRNTLAIQKLAEQDVSIEELNSDTEDQILLTSFDEPGITDLSTNTYEL